MIAALASWGIALFEYLLQVPANRIGYATMTLPQLKILQEVITLTVFVPFVLLYMRQPLKLDYLWAAFCMMGAVYFVFRRLAEDEVISDSSECLASVGARSARRHDRQCAVRCGTIPYRVTSSPSHCFHDRHSPLRRGLPTGR